MIKAINILIIFGFTISILFQSCKKDKNGNVTEVVPISPVDLTATVVSSTQVDLSWVDKSINETGFKIQRKTGTQTFADVGTTGKDVTIYSDKELTAGTTYTYRIYSYNNTGNSLIYTNEVTVTTNNLAIITTQSIENVTNISATSRGSITNDGGSPVTQRGICWATTQNPTTANNTAVSGTGTGSFTANLSGLTANTTYYVRAYAINTVGTAYGNQLSFTTPLTVTDASGNTYPTVTIGSQVWMAENLRTTQYRDGSNIPVVTVNTQWANNWNNNTSLPMMCWYNNDQTTYTTNKFGALYNWYAINPATNGNKNVCPTGWHVPTDAEWTTLTTSLGGESVAGGKMKSTGTQYWLSPNTGATNSSGWSGLPGGYRGSNGTFNFIGFSGDWWSSTEFNTTYAWYRNLFYSNGFIYRSNGSKQNGFSVRCVRD